MPYIIRIDEKTAPFIEKYLNEGVPVLVGKDPFGYPNTFYILPDDPKTETAEIVSETEYLDRIVDSDYRDGIVFEKI